MSSTLMLVTPDNHRFKTWSAPPDFRFARMAPLVSIVLPEVGKASSALPLAFSKSAAGWDLVAALGLPGQPNWLVGQNGTWRGRYIPAAFRAFPFCLASVGEPAQPTLCIDEASGLVLPDGEGQPFFDLDGQPSAALKKFLTLLGQLEQGRKITLQAVELLAAENVFTPLDWMGPGTALPANFPQLFGIDELLLQRLDDAAFVRLRTHGALSLAYAQMLSAHHVDTLRHLQSLQASDVRSSVASDTQETLQAPGLTNDSVLKFS